MKPFPYQMIDLSHALDANVPTWDGGCGFHLEALHDFSKADYATHSIKMLAGIGTHMDAPAHFIPGGATIESFEVLAPGVVLDKGAGDAFSVRDIEAFERAHGEIPPGCFALIRTGWDRYWQQPEKYRLFPGVAKEAAELLLQRQIVGLGVDTLSPDREGSGFPVHRALLGAGKCLIENVANLGALPPVGCFILALPLKIKGGTEAPVRLVGFASLR